ncbi:hypothetical protein MKW98_002372, partial [Papaver atlanticum]
ENCICPTQSRIRDYSWSFPFRFKLTFTSMMLEKKMETQITDSSKKRRITQFKPSSPDLSTKFLIGRMELRRRMTLLLEARATNLWKSYNIGGKAS